jgi:hypothetical protein
MIWKPKKIGSGLDKIKILLQHWLEVKSSSFPINTQHGEL